MNKQSIATSFSRAASRYDQAARLQRDVGLALLARLPALSGATIVDIGCGTGFITRALLQQHDSTVIALDMAAGMLEQTQKNTRIEHCVQADMQTLPLANQCTSLLVSNLAMQWAHNLQQCFCECRRVLTAGGELHFSTFLPGTLHELATSWRAVDQAVHVNRFVAADALETFLRHAGFTDIHAAQTTYTLHHASLRDLAQELKNIGAHNMNDGRPTGLTGKRRWQQLEAAYEQWRTPQGLPATYEVIHVSAA